MSRIFTSFLVVITLLSLSIVAKAANVDALATNQTTNMLADLSVFTPPKEQTKIVPESSSDVFVSPEKAALSGNFKGAVFESENYRFRETSKLESMIFALVCIGFIGLLAARRFKRAFI